MSEHTLAPVAGQPGCFGPTNSLLGLVGVGLRASSAQVYRRDVADFLVWWGHNPTAATGADVAQYLAERGPTPAAADRRLAALAHFYRAGIIAGRWTVDPTAGLPRARRGDWRDRP